MPARSPWDPSLIATVAARRSARLGLVVPAAGHRDHPYNLARRLVSVDHAAQGRVGWLALDFDHSIALNAASDTWTGADLDTTHTDDAVAAIRTLWRTWPLESVVGDTAAGVFADVTQIRRADVRAGYLITGPLNVPGSVQGDLPVWRQATGGSAIAPVRGADLVVVEDREPVPDGTPVVIRVRSLHSIAATLDRISGIPAAHGVLLRVGPACVRPRAGAGVNRGARPRCDRRPGEGTLRERLRLPVPESPDLSGTCSWLRCRSESGRPTVMGRRLDGLDRQPDPQRQRAQCRHPHRILRNSAANPPTAFADPGYYVRMAKIAERGLLDALFLADGPALREHPALRPSQAWEPRCHPGIGRGRDRASRVDRDVVVDLQRSRGAGAPAARPGSAVAGPLRVERGHHISRCRPAVTSGLADYPDRPTRYRRAAEFVDVVRALWQDAADAGARGIDHQGEFFTVVGSLPPAAIAAGYPLLVQAGGSPQGRELAGRAADAVFSARTGTCSGVEHYRHVKDVAVATGRRRSDVKILPGLITTIGGTEGRGAAALRAPEHCCRRATISSGCRRCSARICLVSHWTSRSPGTCSVRCAIRRSSAHRWGSGSRWSA